MSRSTASSFWKEHASETLSPNSPTQSARISSAPIASTVAASGSVNALSLTEQNLLQRVAAQAEPQRLERDHFLRRDVPEVHRGTEVLDEPRLGRLGRRLPDEIVEVDRVLDLGDQAGPHLAVGPEDAGRAALPRLGDHLPGAGFLLLLDPLDPLVRREDDLGVLRADLGEHGEVTREVGDQLQLALARDLDRPVGDLDMRQPEAGQPALVVVEGAACVDDLEKRSADHDGLLSEHLELLREVLRHVRGTPTELDDVDVVARHLEHVCPAARAETLVEHMRETAVARDTKVEIENGMIRSVQ